jgi:hypothetical protein
LPCSQQSFFSFVVAVPAAIDDTLQEEDENGNSSKELDVTLVNGATISNK